MIGFDMLLRFDNKDELFCKPIQKHTFVFAEDWDAAIERAWTLSYTSVKDKTMEVWDPRLQKWLTRR